MTETLIVPWSFPRGGITGSLDLSFFMDVTIELLEKQKQALRCLRGTTVTELLYGGGAGGGKSWLGCYWLITSCIKYPNTRWVMGRAVLKTLKETTLNSFYDVSRLMGLQSGKHYNYNAQTGVIVFYNGSAILLKDLYQYPADKDFDELGSLEITGAFVDECNQIVEKAWEILKSRIRYKLDEYGLVPTIMGSCNPAKNWVYRRFYKPSTLGQLPEHRVFIPALARENNKVSKHYISNLESLSDPTSKARLLNGEWEYDDNPNRLISNDAVNALFGVNMGLGGDHYLTADIARFGSDRAIIVVWEGWRIVEFLTFDISKTTVIQEAINALRTKYNIPKDRCVADDDGVGGGVVDNCGILGFVNNGKPMESPIKDKNPNESEPKENYYNIQAQMGYHLAKKCNAREVVFLCDVGSDEKDIITEDLEQLQSWKADQDGKLRIKPKEEIKKDTGRSPDWRDVLLMRGVFDYKPESWSNILF